MDQRQLTLLYITGGHQGEQPISCIIGHLRGTVRTSHKGRLEWNYGLESALARPEVVRTLGGIQCQG